MGGLGSGDRLARGANRATYSSTEKKVTDEKWAEMFGDYDPEEFKNAPNKSSVRTAPVDGSDADGEPSGDAGSESREASAEPTTR
jgi:hypothetical protein